MKIEYDYNKLSGKSIKQVFNIRAEYGRTYTDYIGFLCEDGTRVMIHGGNPYKPDPEQKEMEKALGFFSSDEIANKAKYEYEKELSRKNDYERRKKEEYLKLKKELNID